MKTPNEIQSEYEARLALRQAEARGILDNHIRAKIERKWSRNPQNPPTERINANPNHEMEGGSHIIPPGVKWWHGEPEWLSDGKRADQWTFSATMLVGAAVLILAFLAFWAL